MPADSDHDRSAAREPECAPGPECSARSRLVAAAGPIFAGRGYDRASLREIAAAAEANVASISYYFGDKMGLYRAVIEQIRLAKEKRYAMPQDIETIPAENRLAFLVRTLLSRVLSCHDEAWESQIMMREMMHPTAALEDLVRLSFEPLFQMFKKTVSELLTQYHPDCVFFEPHLVEQTTLSIVGQCLYYRVAAPVVEILIPWKRREQKYDLDTIAAHIHRLTLSAIQNPSFLDGGAIDARGLGLQSGLSAEPHST